MADVTASLIEDLNLKISGSLGVSGTAGTASGAMGLLSLSAAGLWTYTPDKVKIQALRLGETVVDTLSIGSKPYSFTLRGDNDFAVIGGSLKASVAEDKALAVSGVLTVKDADAEEAVLSTDSQAYFGLFSFNPNSKLWIYTPDATKIQALKAKETVVEKLSVFSVDGTSTVVAVTLSGANDAAVISGTSQARVSEADASLLSASGKLDITDPDANSSSFQKLEKAGKLGGFSLAADGSWTYRADAMNPVIQKLAAGQSLADSFVVKSTDGLSSQVVTVFIDGADGNTLGGRAAITAKAATATLLSGSVAGSIVNLDTGAALSADQKASLVLGSHAGSYGSFSVAADGKWTYILDYTKTVVIALPAGVTLTDSVLVGGARLNVAITGINDIPATIAPISAALTEDAGIVDGWLICSGSLSIIDPDAGESGFQKLVTSTSTSLFSLAENGDWSFLIANSDAALQKLTAGKSLVKKFAVKSLDGKASSSVNITLNGSDILTFSGDQSQTWEDQNQRTQGKLFSLDAGKALTATPALIEGQYGLFSIAKDGRWSYVQQKDLGAGDFVDAVQVSVGTATAALQVTIHSSNDVAILGGNSGGDIGENGSSVTGTLTISDADLGEARFVASSSTGLYGSFAVDAASAWTYTPDARADALGNVTVTDSFLVYSADGASIPVVINISGSNDAPVITSVASASGNEDTSISASLVVSDVENTSFSYSVSTPTKGGVSINSSGLWTYAPSANSNGADSFTVTVSDGSASVTQTINLTVNPVNDVPVINGLLNASFIEDGESRHSGSLSIIDADLGEEKFQVRTQVSGAYGLFSVSDSGLWTYDLANDAASVQGLKNAEKVLESFTVKSLDGSATVIVSIQISGVNDIPVFGGTHLASINEDLLGFSGALTLTDADQGESSVIPGTASTAYGVLTLTSDGHWNFAASKFAQGLNAGETSTLSLLVQSADSSASETLSVIIKGQDEPLSLLDLAVNQNANSLPDLVDSGMAFRFVGSSESISGETLSAGDFNGDGIKDLLIGAYGANPSGAVYLLDGSSSRAQPSTTLPGAQASLQGGKPSDFGGLVQDCGDFDGDGFNDYLVAAKIDGEVFLIYGKLAMTGLDFAIDVNANGIPDVCDNGGGVRWTGSAADGFGASLGGPCDLNGDGYSDLLIGASLADANGQSDSGKVWVIFGGTRYTGSQSVSALSSNQAVQILGAAARDGFGSSLDGAGDVNGDGIDDLVIGAPNADTAGRTDAGQAIVIWGHRGSWGHLNLRSDTDFNGVSDVLDAGAGRSFQAATGEHLGGSVTYLGDVNGDGLADFAVAAPTASNAAGKVWVIFGSQSMDVKNDLALDLSANGLPDWIDNQHGSLVTGLHSGDSLGSSLCAAGDVNGDGYSDILMASPNSDFGDGRSNAGAAVLIFGGSSLAGDIKLSSDNGTLPSSIAGDEIPDFLQNGGGIFIAGMASGDSLEGVGLASVGDSNGDGFDDFAISFGNAVNGSGATYLFLGRDYLNGSTGLISGSGGAGSAQKDLFVGSAAADEFTAIGSGDSVRCGAGDDVIHLTASDFRLIDGGQGNDRLLLENSTLDLRALPEGKVNGIEIFDLSSEGKQKISIDALGLSHLASNGLVRILGTAEDECHLEGLTQGVNQSYDGVLYSTWGDGHGNSVHISLEMILV